MSPSNKMVKALMLGLTSFAFVEANNNLRGLRATSTGDHEPMDIVGFWHIDQSITGPTESRDQLVKKQGQEILNSYMFNEGLATGDYTLKLNYVTTDPLNDETRDFLRSSNAIQEHPPTILPREAGVNYFEYPTLIELHAFCQKPTNNDKIVFYLNTKHNDDYRVSFENYLLGDSCVQCMQNDKKQACGPWYTGTDGFYWKHFSGNYWMARCSHIAELNTPFYSDLLHEGHYPNFYPPTGRIFAKYWMMNDAGPRPERTQDMESIGHGLLERNQVCSDKWLFTKEQEGLDEVSKKEPEIDLKKLTNEDIVQGLWKGRFHNTEQIDPHTQNIHIAVSVCNSDLNWINELTHDYKISSIHIISKCGRPLINAPPDASIELLPNVGRNDHSFAYYISHILDGKLAETNSDPDNSIVMFLKDNNNSYQKHMHWSSMDEMISLAASEHGFSCGLFGDDVLSAYHVSDYLFQFSLNSHSRMTYDREDTTIAPFKSDFENLGHMLTVLHEKPRDGLLQVCYGGSFAASVTNIKKVPHVAWKGFEKVLSRGDNIEEGHFMERSWAALLSTPLESAEQSILHNYANDIWNRECCYNGALMHY